MELNKIYNEDCVLTLHNMPEESISLTVTSPPYGEIRSYKGHYEFQFQEIAQQLFRVTKQGGVVVWVVNDQTKNGTESGMSFEQALYFKKWAGFKLHDTMIYLKKPPPQNQRRYEQHFEYMFVFVKGKLATFNGQREPKIWTSDKRTDKKYHRDGDDNHHRSYAGKSDTKLMGNVVHFHAGKHHSTKDDIAFKHPAIFPEALAEFHIKSWSSEGDIVYDPFTGSGTTLKMAFVHKRTFIGSEIVPEYCEIANKRLQKITGKHQYNFIFDVHDLEL